MLYLLHVIFLCLRWHRAVGSDSGCLEICENEKKGFMMHMKTTMGKNASVLSTNTLKNSTHGRLPKIIEELPSPRGFPKMKTWKLSQNSNLTLNESSRIIGENTVLRARQTRRHLLVTSLTAELQKHPGICCSICTLDCFILICVPHQVNDLLEKVTEKSIDLLAQKHAELQQCEFLGEERLQSSKHFQLASKRTMRMHKLKHMHFPCTCCC
uniref:Uncharacterized protein n=1 Tax=Gopherus evgoodei TaxID=1825980 RepID=A0A8C4W3C7_9SAUR